MDSRLIRVLFEDDSEADYVLGTANVWGPISVDEERNLVFHYTEAGGTALPAFVGPFDLPIALSLDPNDGSICVCESLGDRVRCFSSAGESRWSAMVTQPSRVAVDSSTREVWVTSFTRRNVVRLSPAGTVLDTVVGFQGPIGIAVDPRRGRIWVADACNHRIQVFDTDGKLLSCWGTQGGAPGQLYYPYDLVLAPDKTVYVCEYGNHRVQRFTRDSRSLGCWGSEGRGEGQLYNPWALVRDSQSRFHVLDTNNHRVQCVRMP